MRWTQEQLAQFQARRAMAAAPMPTADQSRRQSGKTRSAQRMPRDNGPLESEIHINLVEHLRHLAAPNVVYWHTPTGELRDVRTAAKLKAMGTVAGIPDLAFLISGRLHFLELKRERGGALSGAQKVMHQALIAAGAEVVTARGLDEALGVLRKWGALRGSEPARGSQSAQRGRDP